MKKEFNVVIEKDAEGYLVASVPQLHGCHTQARSLDQLLERIKETIELCLEEQVSTEEQLLFLFTDGRPSGRGC